MYRNAALTIAADSAKGPLDGFLGAPPARAAAHETCSIYTTAADGPIPVTVYARLRYRNPANPDTAPHSSGPVRPSKLSTRAWALQELLLSTRIVHFYEEEIVWSCYSLQRCECRALSAPPSPNCFRKLFSLKNTLPMELLKEWPGVVQQMTNMDLTFDTDRLPALSGLADAVRDQMAPSEYHTGIWTADLAYTLL